MGSLDAVSSAVFLSLVFSLSRLIRELKCNFQFLNVL